MVNFLIIINIFISLRFYPRDIFSETIDDLKNKTVLQLVQKFNLPAYTAGQHGYDSILFQNVSGFNSNSILISLFIETGSVANNRGLQLTPLFFAYSIKLFYYTYYCSESNTSVEAYAHVVFSNVAFI